MIFVFVTCVRYLNSDCLDHEGIRGYDDDTFAEGSNDFGRRLYDQLTTGPQENLVIIRQNF